MHCHILDRMVSDRIKYCRQTQQWAEPLLILNVLIMQSLKVILVCKYANQHLSGLSVIIRPTHCQSTVETTHDQTNVSQFRYKSKLIFEFRPIYLPLELTGVSLGLIVLIITLVCH